MNMKYICLCGCLMFTGCISYTYHGLVGIDKPAEESLIGISYQDLIKSYGAPDRVIPVDKSNGIMKGQFKGVPHPVDNVNSGGFLAIYSVSSSYDILLYYRDRGFNYTFIIEENRVKDIISVLTIKTDGFGFRGMGGAVIGAGIGSITGNGPLNN